MKNLAPFVFLLFSIIAFSQPINSEIISEESSPKLIGKINTQGLSSKNYSTWFSENLEKYQPNKKIIDKISDSLSNYTITLFLGTWCGDSKKEVPHFYKILEQANFPLERLTAVALDNERSAYKQSPGGEQEGLNIHRVPTFIFYKNGKEINRIIEHPVKSLEEDILHILQNEYSPNYQIVARANNILNKIDLKKFNKKRIKIAKKLKPYAVSFSELNTYSSVLFYANKKEEGIAIARLNIVLYPKKYYGYVNLANKLLSLDSKNEAIKNYKKALQLNPTNEDLKTTLKNLTQNDAG